MRVALYARYSTDLQSSASVEDQFRLCREHAEKEGWEVVARYADHGVSGASMLRTGIQILLQGALGGSFDIVVAEALDRLSRDQEDIAGLFKRLSYAGVKIITLAEGTVSELHIGLKGTMNARFLKDLADKTRRGLRGRVQSGKSGGGLCFGYDVVRHVDASGEPIRGDRVINLKQALVVRRIFSDYAMGLSPRMIAKQLNLEGVAGPAGGTWGPSTIHGNKQRGTGILNNDLYLGQLVWNRLRYVKDPDTGKRISRLNPVREWLVTEVPNLRIIEQSLWDIVKLRQQETGLGLRPDNTQDGFWDRRRPRFLLSGLVKCGVCGSSYVKISQHHFGCASARNRGTCTNVRGIRRDILESTVLDGLQNEVMNDALLDVFCKEYVSHLNTLRSAEGSNRKKDEARLEVIERDLERLVDALVAGVPADRVKMRMRDLETEKTGVEARLSMTPKGDRPLLHPKMGAVYRTAVSRLREILTNGPDKSEATELIRSLIERILVHPAEGGAALIDIEGDLAGILALSRNRKKAVPVSEGDLVQIKLVAGAGFEPATFRL